MFVTYKSVFTGLGRISRVHHINVDRDVIPVIHPPRRIPISLQSKFKATFDALEGQGVIVKVDYPTDWVNSIVLVKKKGELRLCSNPRDLSKEIKRKHYLILTAQDIVSKLNGKKTFYCN